MCLDAPRDDALGQVARVRLERRERAGSKRLHVVVVYGGGLDEDLRLGHRGEELRGRDATCPLLAQHGPILPEVSDEFTQQSGCFLRHEGWHDGWRDSGRILRRYLQRETHLNRSSPCRS